MSSWNLAELQNGTIVSVRYQISDIDENQRSQDRLSINDQRSSYHVVKVSHVFSAAVDGPLDGSAAAAAHAARDTAAPSAPWSA